LETVRKEPIHRERMQGQRPRQAKDWALVVYLQRCP
jgi:hypothetical protein